MSRKSRALTYPEPLGPPWPVAGWPLPSPNAQDNTLEDLHPQQHCCENLKSHTVSDLNTFRRLVSWEHYTAYYRCESFKSDHLLGSQSSLQCQHTQKFACSIQHNYSLLLQCSYMFRSTYRTIIRLGAGSSKKRANMHAKYTLHLFWGHLKNDKIPRCAN